MKIITITVSYGRTHSLPDYCNVKPSLSITAEIEPGDHLDQEVAILDQEVAAYVHGRIDDALEADGQSPRFYDGPLYTLYRWIQADTLVILPATGIDMDDLPGDWQRRRNASHMRHETLLGRAMQIQGGVLDLWDGDLDAVHSWWEERRWYRAYELTRHRRRGEPEQILVIPEDLTPPNSLLLYGYGPENTRAVSQLPGLLSILNREGYSRDLWKVIVLDDESVPDDIPQDRVIRVAGSIGLDEYVAEWYAHLRTIADEPNPRDVGVIIGEDDDDLDEDDYPDEDGSDDEGFVEETEIAF